MHIISRLANRLMRGAQSRPDAPLILIAERFVSPFAELDHLDMPDDLRRVAAGGELDAVVVDEFGTYCRRTRLLPPPVGLPGNRIEFPAMPNERGARFWLFVVDATHDDGEVTPRLVECLLTHARRLGGRPPITLLWDHRASRIAATATSADRRTSRSMNHTRMVDETAGSHREIAASDLAEPAVTFEMLSEDPDPALLPPLDQPDLDLKGLTPEQRGWREDGVLILRGFFPDSILDPYIAVRERLNQPGGWLSPTPYMHVEELRRLCLYPPLRQVMRELIGEEMMLHLNLSGWVTSERDWHQDDYLNPPFINGWYTAVWVALDHIHPDSGPFEYIPGSHRWRLLRGDKVRSFMTEVERADGFGPNGDATWPRVTERFVAPAVDYEIHRRGIPARQFLAEKGDTLIWHGRLLHRGTLAKRPGMARRAIIAHYSGVNHRPDMLSRKTDTQGGVYAVFDRPLF
ncbi:MAG TPA: phytanoyl-CoA dioxygenase family protein [Acetobacteraceae bacterium]|nr:phytanoyl-CoA dioxygenase family protein [Acetobacteraceae bacterium]